MILDPERFLKRHAPIRRTMNHLNRRQFLLAAGATTVAAFAPTRAQSARPPLIPNPALEQRIRGLILGSAIGDALGGPIEFQPQDAVQTLDTPPKIWRDGEKLDAPAREAAVARLRMRPYLPLRPVPESYGQWNHNSPPGTITDDTRHKLILLHALHEADRRKRWPITARNLAQSYVDWPRSKAVAGRPGYPALAQDWLEEYHLSSRWILGERDPARALPPERMWQSLPTCCGQMTLPPLAAIFAGQPEHAYLAAYHLGYVDNGIGKDLNAALIAGLATALTTSANRRDSRASFAPVLDAMRSTDPLRFGKIRWSERAVDRWLNLATKWARDAAGEPARLFAMLEKEFAFTTKWEAQVPFVVTFACLEIADYEPLAALQLSMEWGHDTDSYAQLAGAFIGAMYGPELFPPAWIQAVVERLQADHGVNLDDECRFLTRLHESSATRRMVSPL